MMSANNSRRKKNWLKVWRSVCSAFFGVQTEKNLTSDFSSESVWPFLLTGLVLLAVFIITIVIAVKLILFYVT